MDELAQVQDEVMDRYEEVDDPENTDPESMYFLGKDVGISQAKQVIRECVEVGDE